MQHNPWAVPREVSDEVLAFPVGIEGVYLPHPEDIPQEFLDPDNEFVKIAERLITHQDFGDEVEGLDLKPGISDDMAGRHLNTIIGFPATIKGHKQSALAYLLSLWVHEVVRTQPSQIAFETIT